MLFYSQYISNFLSLFFYYEVAPDKKLWKFKLLVVFFVKIVIIDSLDVYKSGQVIVLLKVCLSIPNLHLEIFMVCKKTVFNGLSLEVYTPFYTVLRT